MASPGTGNSIYFPGELWVLSELESVHLLLAVWFNIYWSYQLTISCSMLLLWEYPIFEEIREKYKNEWELAGKSTF